MRILKFGGTSVGGPEQIEQTLAIISSYYEQNLDFAVVVSAMGGVTNQLIAMSQAAEEGNVAYEDLFKQLQQRHFSAISLLLTAQEQSDVFLQTKKLLNALEDVLQGVYLTRECTPRAYDFILSHGERLNAVIIAAAAASQGLPAVALDATGFIVTDAKFGGAKVDFEKSNQKIQRRFSSLSGKIPIVTGFVSASHEGLVTTLGRGGSDYTASILAAALKAEQVEIWTDVNGVLTADPRKVKDAFSLRKISYQEAMEMSHFGAKVIYPPTLQPVFKSKIPIYIKNTFEPEFPGTLISEDSESLEDSPVKGLSSINDVAVLNIQGSGMVGVSGTSSRIFEALAKAEINVILITQASSEHSICLAIAPENATAAKESLEAAFFFELQHGQLDPIVIERNLSVIALIGDNMANVPGIAGNMFRSLGQNGINIRAIAQGSSERNISVVIEQQELTKALNALHDALFLSDLHTLNIFMVGHGLVGKDLLKQMAAQKTYLLEERHLRIQVVGLCNRSHMLIEPDGLNIDAWQEDMESKGEATDLKRYIERMIALNMPNSIFVDNTSDPNIVRYYERILSESIHIVTPNKSAASGKLQLYKHLTRLARRRGVSFLYETNVGAGLPVISTLQDLMQCGDQVYKIEGVFSGTLSFIFNTYDGEKSFASVVKEAQDRGFTEPDPREDLSGADAARKILILARVAGFEIEANEVDLQGFLPASCLEASNVSAFYEALVKEEAYFKDLYQTAQLEGKKLRMIAALANGKASVKLEAVSAEHPLYGLNGSDNMIAYTTLRYAEQPLVVRGPGAGAAVTATGVFSDIIRAQKR